MTNLRFAVHGTPAPQGSKSAVVDRNGRARILEGRTTGQRRRHTAWRDAVAWSTLAAMRAARRTTPLLGPVRVELLFVHARPKSTPKGHRWRAKTPDIDKIVRSTLDGIAAGSAIGDDAQVAELHARKVLALPGETEGCVVAITALDHTDGPPAARELAAALPGVH